MDLYCFGLSYKSTPVELREKVAFSAHEVSEATKILLNEVSEATILSTCNRVEIYFVADLQQCAATVVRNFIRDYFKLNDEALNQLNAYFYKQGEAAKHLFEVVAGLDSMVLGETEIQGQVKQAYDLALNHGFTAKTLNKLFQQAFATGKKVRSETLIQRGSTSVGSVAVDLAEKVHDLKACQIMLVGAGEMSRVCAQSLMSRGAKSIIVSNRHFDKAELLAAEMGGVALPYDDLEDKMHEVDIVISSTSAPHYVITEPMMKKVMKKRGWRSMFVIDIAVPRDVDPVVNSLDGVYLYDIDALQSIAMEGRKERERQLSVCLEIVGQQLNKFGYLQSN
jgi:glutamyl-tRNA reductase